MIPPSADKVEMYVATTLKPGEESSSAMRMMVLPPRQKGAAAVQQAASPAKAETTSETQQKAAADNRAIRAELASTASQLQTKKSQLKQADAAIR